MTIKYRFGGLVLAAALAACGGGGDDPAADECRALLDAICDRVVECGAFGGIDHGECVDQSESGLPEDSCDGADMVGATYASCLTMVGSATCADLFPSATTVTLPPDCTGVIQFEP